MASHRAAFVLLCMAMLAGAAFAQVIEEALTLTPANPPVRAQLGTVVTGKLTGALGASTITTTLGPCVMRSLHTHTNTELLYVIEGSIDSYQIREDGTLKKATLVAGQGNVTAPQAVVYPALRQHLQYNPNCKAAKFIAFFGATTTVTVNIPAAQTPAILPSFLFKRATVGPVPAPFSLQDSGIPIARPYTPAAAGTFSFLATEQDQVVDECLRRCLRVLPKIG